MKDVNGGPAGSRLRPQNFSDTVKARTFIHFSAVLPPIELEEGGNHLTSMSPGKYINQVILVLTCGTQVREHCFHDYLLQRGPECAPLLASVTPSVLKR